jgi:protein involved in polysaccharide export with SLBB domain
MPTASRLPLLAYTLIAVSVFFTACETPPASNAGNLNLPDNAAIASLRPGDSLVVTLQGVPDPSSNPVQIDDQGLVTLPFIGPVSTSGTTTATLSQRIRETYIAKKIYTTVDVSVAVTERYVYVGGEVIRPGRIIWTPDLTVTKAIQSAGGFTLYAKENRLSLVRDRVAHPINATLAEKNPAEDPRLMPGDSIQVPKSAF